MKTARITNIASAPGMTIALALFAGSLFSALGEPATAKGAAKLLMKTETPVASAAEKTMSCPKCKDNYTVSRDLSARGVNKPSTTVVHHLCPGCATSVTSVGQGKAKHDVMTHVCTAGGTAGAGCCAQ